MDGWELKVPEERTTGKPGREGEICEEAGEDGRDRKCGDDDDDDDGDGDDDECKQGQRNEGALRCIRGERTANGDSKDDGDDGDGDGDGDEDEDEDDVMKGGRIRGGKVEMESW
ncbi:hypothetical protein TWF718_004574 [Orbilia javanica]|uniref:Uncharacterized protein n=1 Tax=Orbilia javanica TaxID=47235 RepID=A0AAN8RF45_9PEZI